MVYISTSTYLAILRVIRHRSNFLCTLQRKCKHTCVSLPGGTEVEVLLLLLLFKVNCGE